MFENLINNLSLYLESSILLALIASYIGGLIVSFTPCTYPLIPVTIGVIGAHGSSSRQKGFLVSAVYVLGLAVTYSTLGAVAALSGKIFGQIQTTPWTYFIMANLCLLMGLSMLDVFNIALPVPKKLFHLSAQNNQKGFVGSFLIGAASGVVIGPCTAPALGVLLGYVALKTNVLLGVGLLFVFALGLGTLLLIVGTFTGMITALPKSGAWMTKIKYASGLILIGAAEYFLYIAGTLSI
jgi:thiol:disulfide interchange protein DsbD